MQNRPNLLNSFFLLTHMWVNNYTVMVDYIVKCTLCSSIHLRKSNAWSWCPRSSLSILWNPWPLGEEFRSVVMTIFFLCSNIYLRKTKCLVSLMPMKPSASWSLRQGVQVLGWVQYGNIVKMYWFDNIFFCTFTIVSD